MWMLRWSFGAAAKTDSGFRVSHFSLLQDASHRRSIPGSQSLAIDLVKSTRTKLSVVVPVFNEAPLIRPFLRHLRERAPSAEIIVAECGSTDGTADLASGFCDQLVLSKCNRAIQMNTGAG